VIRVRGIIENSEFLEAILSFEINSTFNQKSLQPKSLI